MSWQLGAFAILIFALALGFAWYERTSPDARIVALVATLAALAALGRVAFAALPNVKPTTDIVLIAGYALGGAAGFAVGATAGLTSNFFFGQGPWTPWQMVGWGAAGILGAALALATRRRIGRLPLAACCGVVGFGFAAFQDVGDWVTFSDHSAAQLGLYVGKGVGFDFIHAASCVGFALAFGPPMIRSIQRFARRLQVTWEPVGTRAGAGAAVMLTALVGTWVGAGMLFGGAGELARAAASPSGYLLASQNADGGLGAARGQSSSPLYSGWAALGLAASGHDPADVRHGRSSLLGYIRGTAASATDPGSLERTILVVRAAGGSPRTFGGSDLIARLERNIRADGSVNDQVNLTSFAVLALRADGLAAPDRTLAWLVRQQDRDGGFSFATAGASSDVDDTGAALQALAGAGGSAIRARGRAVGFIARQQDRDGGFPSQPGGESNAQSTAWAIQGLISAGVNPGSLHRARARSPLQFLASLTAADGHIRYSRSSDQTPVWVTGQALMALAGKSLPLAAPARSHAHARSHASTHHRRSAARVGKRPARRSHRAHQHHARTAAIRKSPALNTLAADAACAAALALGPVGLA